MSATYNWAYKPGIPNKYNLNVPASADDVRPAGWCYVALSGNDTSGNGSRKLPFRTLSKALGLGNGIITVAASGVYWEPFGGNGVALIGDGHVILDGTTRLIETGLQGGGGNAGSAYNITLRNWIKALGGLVGLFDCTIQDSGFSGLQIGSPGAMGYAGYNTFIRITPGAGTIAQVNTNQILRNNTFIDCVDLIFNNNVPNPLYLTLYNIFQNCNILFQQASYLDYSLFYKCNVRFAAARTQPATFYPTTPPGYTKIDSIGDLRSAQLAAFPTATFNFPQCVIADPKFNNSAVGDLTLAFDSPARNLTYFGNYAGARPIARSILAKAAEVDSGFESASAVNLTIADDNITLTDAGSAGQIDSKPIVNAAGRDLAGLPAFGYNADRNGQYLDSLTDLAGSVKTTSDTLTAGLPFLVENAAITYNGATYQPGARFTTITGVSSFSSAGGGVIREITEAPQRHTILMRVSDGGAEVSVGTPLTAGYYYYVASGSVSYHGDTYSTGQLIKAMDSAAFGGTGVVNLALSTESYQHYELGLKPMTNNSGDSRAGAIVRGNGDPVYERNGGTLKEFPVNARFIQLRCIFQVNNLKP
jgi:hypothetical protein